MSNDVHNMDYTFLISLGNQEFDSVPLIQTPSVRSALVTTHPKSVLWFPFLNLKLHTVSKSSAAELPVPAQYPPNDV